MESDFLTLYQRAAPFTMTTVERMYGLWQAVAYLHREGIAGDILECGVWRGGSSLLAALTLMQLGDSSRTLYLFDTFEGMTAPSEHDASLIDGQSAQTALEHTKREAGAWSVWSYATLEDVQETMSLAGYPRVEYVRGPVEKTVPDEAPEKLALLRLDTDWYESTRHELEHLWPRLVPGGVLIIDDYGDWQGARKAVDEYFSESQLWLIRLDHTGRLALKS